jgi:hypothetical protein
MPEETIVTAEETPSQDTTKTVETTPAPEGDTGETDTQETPDTDEPAEPQPDKTAEKLAKENARMAKALANLQKENAALKSKPADTPAPKADTTDNADTDVHPALKGLEVDDTTGDVYYKGVWVAPEFAIAQEELIATNRELREWKQAQESAKRDAEVAEAQRELAEAVISTVTGLREEAMPDITPEAAEMVDKLVIDMTEKSILSEAAKGTELTPEAITNIGKETVKQVKTLLGVMGEQQIRDNAKYKETNPVKPDCIPGTPEPQEPTDRASKAKLTAERTRLAEAMRKQV